MATFCRKKSSDAAYNAPSYMVMAAGSMAALNAFFKPPLPADVVNFLPDKPIPKVPRPKYVDGSFNTPLKKRFVPFQVNIGNLP